MDGLKYTRTVTKHNVLFLINPAGYVKAQTEYDLYRYIEKTLLKNKEYIVEHWIDTKNRIEYYLPEENTYIEVKNHFLKTRDIKQLNRYRIILEGDLKPFKLKLICMGVDIPRYRALTQMGIEVLLIKDLITG